jgi:hypothetical protein
MERARGDSLCQRSADVGDAFSNLSSRLVCEREHAYPLRRYTVADEPSNARRCGLRLSATRTGQYEQRPPIVQHGSPLRIVQAVQDFVT